MKYCVKALAFLGVLGGLLCLACSFFQPKWFEWNNYDTTHGFYMEPRNTIETVFLGSSVMVNGIIPAVIYDEAGVCAYNLGTEQQPVLASFHWLKEAYRLHGKTLKTVVLDASMLRRVPDMPFYQKAIDNMALSGNKLEATRAYTQSATDFWNHLVPLFAYHERWREIQRADFPNSAREVNQSVRGYHYENRMWIDNEEYSELPTAEYYLDPGATATELNAEAVQYFTQMAQFCRQHGLKLVLIKTPTVAAWIDSDHMAAAKLAEENDLEFIDFNYIPLLDELGFDFGLDLEDHHMNYYGAVKLSRWFGRYLRERCENRDVRGAEGYAFMDAQLAEYNESIGRTEALRAEENVAEYIGQAMQQSHSVVLISVKDDCAYALTDEQRARFAALGLQALSEVGFRDTYLAFIEDGRIKKEVLGRCPAEPDDTVYEYAGRTGDGRICRILSGGAFQGDLSSITIDDVEYSPNARGFNIVVYDKARQRVVDATSFDTCVSTLREGDIAETLQRAREDGTPYYELPDRARKAWMYDRRSENSKYEAYWELFCADDQLFEYMAPYLQNRDYVICIAVEDEAANALDAAARERLRRMGLVELPQLEYQDSYIGVIDDGKVCFEQRDHGRAPITYEKYAIQIVSGGGESGNTSSMLVDNQDFCPLGRGLKITIYDKALRQVVSQAAFDTHATPVSLSGEQSAEEVAAS